MTNHYQAVGWNPQKRRYDAALLGFVAAWFAIFLGVGFALFPDATAETLLIRASGTGALLLLHVVLAIGPLCRIDARYLPLLYNRRHLGVTMFGLGLAHGFLATFQFHAWGNLDPLVSLFSAESRFTLSNFPFQPLGFAALVILAVMAATSHDFWLANLGPRTWKTIHMSVYAAWALIVLHVALGALQTERNVVLAIVLGLGVVAILALHLVAGRRETRADEQRAPRVDDAFVDVGPLENFPVDEGRVVQCGGERIAVFRHKDGVSAISNVCRHQGGPLGEGRIVDGCVTCPWHGYQYLAANGCSPPPFTEKVETFRVAVASGRVRVDPRANAPGTPVAPARVATEPRA